ncbi:hypothetical protein OWR29_33565 [Actinoplanes sp. Pm04-4]|uniref:Bacterial Ig-like domain-containing protein n=1 Tax=Paractinoplanes pyxinae TaxID=2997416 RepID=A0ABT4B8X8_9ACTN|nr:hypothetical protein [Actinoplanes pyxinae]MCY1142949.1 hypothetical protein [Actinoplanes pyxinae]
MRLPLLAATGLLAVASTLTWTEPAAAAASTTSDHTPPVVTVVSGGIVPPVVWNNGVRRISVLLRITDDGSGWEPGQAQLRMQSPQGTVVDLSEITRVAGTGNDGLWQFATTLPRFAAPGTWRVFQADLWDRAQNLTTVTTHLSFTVIGKADTTPPVVHWESAKLSANTFDNSQDRVLKVRVAATDDLSGVISTPGAVFLESPSGDWSSSEWGTKVSGTPTNGTWNYTVTLPAGAAAGTWHVYSATMYDEVGNANQFGSREFATVTVTG